MSVLTPSSRLLIVLSRLSQSALSAADVTEPDVLGFVSEGHREIVERCGLLEQIQTIVTAEGVREYGLPVDYYDVLGVYVNGTRLSPLPERLAASGDAFPDSYYQRTGLIGLSVLPTASGSALVHYLASPQEFETWDDTPVFGAEWDYLLVEYAAWRIYLLGADAADIGYAEWRHRNYEQALATVAERNARPGRSTPTRLQVIADQVADAC